MKKKSAAARATIAAAATAMPAMAPLERADEDLLDWETAAAVSELDGVEEDEVAEAVEDLEEADPEGDSGGKGSPGWSM